MKTVLLKSVFWVGVAWSLWALGCTETPLSERGIERRSTDLRGVVEVAPGESAKEVFLWLEDTPISARTDAQGAFHMVLPPSGESSNIIGGGSYKLYCYLANYALDAARVEIHNGQFLQARADVNQNGELINPFRLRKILNIDTIVEPELISTDFNGSVNVQVSLSAVLDSVTVVFPKMVGGLLGAIFIKQKITDQLFIEIPDVGANTRPKFKLGREQRSWRLVYNYHPGMLPAGVYEIIPYFLIEQEEMPSGLLANISAQAEAPVPDFLKIPVTRQGGQLVVSQ